MALLTSRRSIQFLSFKTIFATLFLLFSSLHTHARNPCEEAGGVSLGPSCFCSPENYSIDPATQFCAERILCKNHQLLENFLQSDAQVLASQPGGTFLIREVDGVVAQRSHAIVYMEPSRRIRFILPWMNLSYNQQALVDALVNEAKSKGLKKPLFQETFCDGRSVLPPNEPVLVEPVLFTEADWYKNGFPTWNPTTRAMEVSLNTAEIEADFQTFQENTQFERSRLHQAQFFHGSNSASLLSFTQYNQSKGKLIPTGMLEATGKVPFSGVIMYGRSGVNQKFLSTTHAGAISYAKDHAKASPWNPEIGRSLIDNSSSNIREVNIARLREWEKLSKYEKHLVENSFPVLYGFRLSANRRLDLVLVSSDIEGEIGILNGVGPTEIKVIFVPRVKMQEVEKLVRENFPTIQIEPLELFF